MSTMAQVHRHELDHAITGTCDVLQESGNRNTDIRVQRHESEYTITGTSGGLQEIGNTNRSTETRVGVHE